MPGWVRLVSNTFPVQAGDCLDFEAWVRSSGTPADYLEIFPEVRIGQHRPGTADEGIRTLDLSFTKAVLYH